MPNPVDQTPATNPESLIARKISQARLALGFERLWAALHWPLVILGLAAVLVIGGILPQLPHWSRLAVLAVLTLALLWSLSSVIAIRWPTRADAMRRVEERTGLATAPSPAMTTGWPVALPAPPAGDLGRAQGAPAQEHGNAEGRCPPLCLA